MKNGSVADTRRRLLDAGKDGWKYLSVMTAQETRQAERLNKEGKLETRLGHRQGWVKAN